MLPPDTAPSSRYSPGITIRPLASLLLATLAAAPALDLDTTPSPVTTRSATETPKITPHTLTVGDRT